jgi:hypothetical protein
MKRLLVCSISIAPVLACGSGISDSEPPFLRGRITSRAPIVYGVQDATGTRLDSIPAMFVDGVGIWPASEPCAAQARLAIGGNTQVLRQGVPVDTGQLAIGRRVAVWISGVVLESCPPQAGAVRVVLEDTR